MNLKAVVHVAEEGGFWAEVPALPGCVTQGETIEEALENLKAATAIYLEEFPQAATGHPLVTMFSLPEPLHA